MRAYTAASGFPLGNIGDMLVPRLILGHLPFLGESYQGPKKNREYTARFSNVRNTIKILRTAVEKYGLTVTAAGMMANNELTSLFFEAIKETEKLTDTEMAVIPCVQIPMNIAGRSVDTYRRWLTYYEIERGIAGERLLQRYLEDPVLQCRSGWEASFKETLRHSKPYGEQELRDLQIDYEVVDREISSLNGFKVLFAELGSETDFLAMTDRLDLLAGLVDYLRNNCGYRVLLGVHHAGVTIPKLENSGIDFEGYVTPINKVGIMMFPTRDMALKAISVSRKPVIAIKPLAGGRVKPAEALEHVYKKQRIDFCMIGVGSEREAEEDFSTALRILTGQLHQNR